MVDKIASIYHTSTSITHKWTSLGNDEGKDGFVGIYKGKTRLVGETLVEVSRTVIDFGNRECDGE